MFTIFISVWFAAGVAFMIQHFIENRSGIKMMLELKKPKVKQQCNSAIPYYIGCAVGAVLGLAVNLLLGPLSWVLKLGKEELKKMEEKGGK